MTTAKGATQRDARSLPDVELVGGLSHGAPANLIDQRKSARGDDFAARPWAREPRLLVLGIIPSLTWSVTRCLSRGGYKPVVLGWHRWSPLSLLPDCTYEPLVNVNWIEDELDPDLAEQVEAACKKHDVDLVLPVDFPGVMLMARHGSRVQSARVAAVPDPDLMIKLHDKWRFSQVLGELGIAQPRTAVAHNVEELRRAEIPFPIITKPIDRWASVGFQLHRSPQELEQTIANGGLSAEFPLLVQDFIPGKDVGFAFLARQGKLIAHAAFEQPKLGVRRYFDAGPLVPNMERLLEATGYHGLGEIDTRYDPSRDEYRVLEVNPRCWASILYAQHAGMNFPELLMRMSLTGPDAKFTGRVRPVRLSHYELGVAKVMQLAERVHSLKLRYLG